MASGLDHRGLDDLTPAEARVILAARQKFLDGQFDRLRFAMHEAACLNSFAMHQPSKMPKFKSMVAPSEPEPEDHGDPAAFSAFLMSAIPLQKD